MPFLVFFIIVSLSFYVYYKIQYVRSNRPMERKMLSGKSSMALGLFVSLFGVNQLFLHNTTVTYIIAPIFIIVGLASTWVGFRTYRHHVPYAIKEAEDASQ